MSLRILFPAPYQIEISRLRQQLDFVIENIRFAHDPHWNTRLFSVQSARDGGHWFWRVTHSLVIYGAPSI
jgi:hypothetical protein